MTHLLWLNFNRKGREYMHFYQTIEVYCASVYASKIIGENKRERTEIRMVGHKAKHEQYNVGCLKWA